MSLRLREEFRIAGTLSEEAWRNHGYLRDIDSDSVLTGGAGDRGSAGSARRNESAGGAIKMMQMARFADPAYQAMSARINADLDRMDERAVDVLQKIEHARNEPRRKRENLSNRYTRMRTGVGPVVEAFDPYIGQISVLNKHRDAILEGMAEGEQLVTVWTQARSRRKRLNNVRKRFRSQCRAR